MTGPHRAGAPVDGRAAPVRVMVRRLDPDLPAPGYAHPGDAGLDLQARTDVVLAPGDRALMPTGVAIALPEGYAAFTHPRSGLATRHGITLVNAPGTIDAGYRGEIMVNLINLDPVEAFEVRRGDRIAQLVVQQVDRVELVEVDSLPDSRRGDTGHGASGGFGQDVDPVDRAART
ncbi:MAG: dUTP diphosphatase [Dermatophilaceae bacterium]